MEFIKTVINICIFILAISLMFSLIRFIVTNFLVDFYQMFYKKTLKTFDLLKERLKK